jgi:spore maturation protein CgeB
MSGKDRKTIMISAPEYYGVDSDIRDAVLSLGFNARLVNQLPYGTLEKVGIKLANRYPFIRTFINPFQKASLRRENREFLARVTEERPDLIFVVKGDFLFPDTLRAIRDIVSCPVVAYAWDEPFCTSNRNIDVFRKSNFRDGAALYDHIFVFDEFYVEEVRKEGAKNVSYLPLATNPNRYQDVLGADRERRSYQYDVSFIGLPFDNRVQMFDCLRDYNFAVFGDHWVRHFAKRGQDAPSYYRGRATGAAVSRIYAASKIVLNIHHPQSIEGLNTRTFDIPACGAFEMVDYKKSVEKHFEVDKEMVTFKGDDELKRKIEFYLQHDDLRIEIAARGRERVLSEHTWLHRIRDNVISMV